MKKILSLILITFIITSCELIKNATEIDLQSDYKLSFQVNLGSNDNTINETQLIELTEDEDIEKYKDNLEEVQIDSVLLSITSYSGPSNETINASLKYSKATEATGTTFSVINNLDISDLYISGKSYKISYNESEIVKASDIMLKDLQIKLYLEGTASEVPVDFTMNIILYATIIAQPLD